MTLKQMRQNLRRRGEHASFFVWASRAGLTDEQEVVALDIMEERGRGPTLAFIKGCLRPGHKIEPAELWVRLQQGQESQVLHHVRRFEPRLDRHGTTLFLWVDPLDTLNWKNLKQDFALEYYHGYRGGRFVHCEIERAELIKGELFVVICAGQDYDTIVPRPESS